MNHTKIQWTDETWNPVTGCKAVSPGCANCYAAQLAATRLNITKRYEGLAVLNEAGRGVWTGSVKLHPDLLDRPLRKTKPKKIFVCDMSDLFHEDVPDSFLDQVFEVMRTAKQHIFQVLTKRIHRAADYLRQKHSLLVSPNIWIGTSIENQATCDERLWRLATIPARVRFLSMEPLLEEVVLPPFRPDVPGIENIHWVILGGESGYNARECDVWWIRSIIRQCQPARIAVFVKQLGSKPFITERHLTRLVKVPLKLADKKGGDILEFPRDLKKRLFPFEMFGTGEAA